MTARRAFKITGPVPLAKPTERQQAQLIRLCIFVNVLQTIVHLASSAPAPPSRDTFSGALQVGHDLVTYLLLVGVLKEGADALRECQSLIDTAIKDLKGAPVDAEPVADCWARLKHGIDKLNPASLWKRCLEPVRNNAAFHWKRSDIEAICLSFSGNTVPYFAYREANEPADAIGSVRFTFGDVVLGRVAFAAASTKSESADESLLEIATEEARAFAADMVRVLGTVLTAYVNDGGGTRQVFDAL